MDNYENYNNYDTFKLCFGINGDSFDRFHIRIFEMKESSYLLRIFINDLFLFEKNKRLSLLGNLVKTTKENIIKPFRGFVKRNMESLISHFKFYTEGYFMKINEYYSVIEAPKGEFALGFIANNTPQPYRCRIKGPGLLHVQGLKFLSVGILLSDLVVIIGTLDLVFGEVDK